MTLLDMNICTVEDVEVVHSNMLQMTEELKHRFEEELEQMDVRLLHLFLSLLGINLFFLHSHRQCLLHCRLLRSH